MRIYILVKDKSSVLHCFGHSLKFLLLQGSKMGDNICSSWPLFASPHVDQLLALCSLLNLCIRISAVKVESVYDRQCMSILISKSNSHLQHQLRVRTHAAASSQLRLVNEVKWAQSCLQKYVSTSIWDLVFQFDPAALKVRKAVGCGERYRPSKNKSRWRRTCSVLHQPAMHVQQ